MFKHWWQQYRLKQALELAKQTPTIDEFMVLTQRLCIDRWVHQYTPEKGQAHHFNSHYRCVEDFFSDLIECSQAIEKKAYIEHRFKNTSHKQWVGIDDYLVDQHNHPIRLDECLLALQHYGYEIYRHWNVIEDDNKRTYHII